MEALKEVKRNGEMEEKRNEIFEAFSESELAKKIEEATVRVIEQVLQGDSNSEKVEMQRKLVHAVLNDQVIKGYFQQFKEDLMNDESIMKWASATLDSIEGGKDENEKSQVPITMEVEEQKELKTRLQSELESIIKNLYASRAVVADDASMKTPAKKMRVEEVQISTEKGHPLIGRNVAALDVTGNFIIAKVVRYSEQDERFTVKDIDTQGKQKIFEAKSIVDFEGKGYGQDTLTVGQDVMALYPLGDNEVTTQFYPATVISLSPTNLKVEYKEGGEQVILKYIQVFSESDCLYKNPSIDFHSAQKEEKVSHSLVESTPVDESTPLADESNPLVDESTPVVDESTAVAESAPSPLVAESSIESASVDSLQGNAQLE